MWSIELSIIALVVVCLLVLASFAWIVIMLGSKRSQDQASREWAEWQEARRNGKN